MPTGIFPYTLDLLRRWANSGLAVGSTHALLLSRGALRTGRSRLSRGIWDNIPAVCITPLQQTG